MAKTSSDMCVITYKSTKHNNSAYKHTVQHTADLPPYFPIFSEAFCVKLDKSLGSGIDHIQFKISAIIFNLFLNQSSRSPCFYKTFPNNGKY